MGLFDDLLPRVWQAPQTRRSGLFDDLQPSATEPDELPPMPEPARLSPFPRGSWVEKTMENYTRSREGLDRLHAEARAAGVPLGRATQWKRKQLEQQALAGELQAPETPPISLADVAIEDPNERQSVIRLAQQIQSGPGAQWPNAGDTTSIPGEGEDRELTSALSVLEGFRRQTAPEVPGPQFIRRMLPRTPLQPEASGPPPIDRSAFETVGDIVATAGTRLGQGLANAGVAALDIGERAARTAFQNGNMADTLAAIKWRLRGRGAELDAQGRLRQEVGGFSTDALGAVADEIQSTQMPQRDGTFLGDVNYYANVAPAEIARMGADLVVGGAAVRGGRTLARAAGGLLHRPAESILQMAPLSAGVLGNTYQQSIDRGLTPSESAAEMAKGLAFELGPELLGAAAILGKLPVGQAMQRTISGRAAIAAGTEASTEAITAETQIANEDWLRRQRGEAPLTDEEKAQMRQDALVIGGVAGGALGAGAAALDPSIRAAALERSLRRGMKPTIGDRSVAVEEILRASGADTATAAGAASAATVFDRARNARPLIDTPTTFEMPTPPGPLRSRQRLPGSLQGVAQPEVSTNVESLTGLMPAQPMRDPGEDRSLAEQLTSVSEIEALRTGQVSTPASPAATAGAATLPDLGTTAKSRTSTLREQRRMRAADGLSTGSGGAQPMSVLPDAANTAGPGAGTAGRPGDLPTGVRFADIADIAERAGAGGGVGPVRPLDGELADRRAPAASGLELNRGPGRSFLPQHKPVAPEVRPFFSEPDNEVMGSQAEKERPTFAPTGRKYGEAPEGATMLGTYLDRAEIPAAALEVADAFLALAKSDRAKQLPTSVESEIQKIAKDVDPQIKITREQPRNLDPGVREGYVIRMRDGTQAYLNVEENGTLQLNAVELKEGKSGGAALYNIVNRFAAANNYVAEPDRNGLTDINRFRRTEQQAASAVREGTAKHLRTAKVQGVGLDPTGDDKVNIGRLLLTGMGNVLGNVIEADQMRYNFESGRFEWTTGEVVDDEDFRRIAKSPLAREVGAGSSTIKRAVFAASVVREARRGRRGAVLGEASRQQLEQLVSPALVGMLYSTKPGQQRKPGPGVTGAAPAVSGVRARSGVEGIKARLAKGLGARAIRRLLDNGVLTVVATRQDLPQRVRDSLDEGDYQGVYHKGVNAAYLIADEMDADPVAVALHEVGVHYGMRNVLGPNGQELLREFEVLRKRGDGAVVAAFQRAEEAGTRAEDLTEEAMAYYIEENSTARSGLVARVVDAIRAWLNQTLKIPLSVLGADTVVGVARGALERAAMQRREGEAGREALASRRRAPTWQSTKDARDTVRALTSSYNMLRTAAGNTKATLGDEAQKRIRIGEHYEEAARLLADYEGLIDAEARDLDARTDIKALRAKALEGDRVALRDLEKLTKDREAIKAEIAAARRAGAKFKMHMAAARSMKAADIEPLMGQLNQLKKLLDAAESTLDKARKLRDWWKARENSYYNALDTAIARREDARHGLNVGIGPAVPNSAAFEIRATENGVKWKGLRGAKRRIRRALQDRMIAFRDAQKDVVEQGGVIDDLSDVYTLETLMHGRAAGQIETAEREIIEPMFEVVAKHKLTVGEIEDYLEARYAQYRNESVERRNPENKAGSGVSTEDANDYLAGRTDGLRGKQKLTAEKRRQLEEVETYIRKLTKLTRDKMLSSGLIDADLHNTLSQDEFYVPLRHFEEGETPRGDGFLEGLALDLGLPTINADFGTRRGTNRGLDTRSAGLQRALGRTTRAQNILGEVIGNYQRAVLVGEKNRVGQGLLRMALQNRAPGLWQVEKVETELKYSESTGLAYRAAKVDSQDPQTLAVFVDGVRYHVWLQEDLARAAKRMAEPELGMVLAASRFVNRMLSNLYTNLSPTFALVNPIRDAQLGLLRVADDHGAATAATAAAGWKNARGALRAFLDGRKNGRGTMLALQSQAERDKWMQYAEEFVNAGAMTGYVQALRPDQIESLTTARLKMQTGEGVVGKLGRAGKLVAKHTIDWVSAANTANENALRLSTYATLREKGLTANQAARYAKDLTVNFNRKGEWGTQINALSLFFNAAVQGSHAVLKTVTGPTARKTLAVVAVAQAVLAFFGMDEIDEETGERYWDTKLSEWEKQRHFIIPIGGGEFIKIPTGYGLNIFPYTGLKVAELMRRAIDGDSDLAVGQAVGQVLGAIGTAFIPIETTLPGAFVPSAVRPIVEAAHGKDTFSGALIAPPESYDRYPTARAESYWPGTPAWAVAAARAAWLIGGGAFAETRTEKPVSFMDWSPNEIQYIVKQYTGGPGQVIGGVIDAAASALTGQLPDLNNPLNIPVRALTTFARDPERAVGGLFKQREQKLLRLIDEGKAIYAEQGNDAWEAFKARHAEYLSGVELEETERAGQEILIARREDDFAAAHKDASRALKALRIERRSIINDTSLSFTERRRKADEVEAEIAALQRKTLLEFNTQRGR